MIALMKHPSTALCTALVFALLSCGDQKSATAQPGSTANSAIPCPSSIPLAALVAESDLIVAAAPDVPVDRLKAAMLQASPDYVGIRLLQPSVLKGKQDAASLTVQVYPKTTTYSPAPDAFLKQAGTPALLFLTTVDREPTGIFLSHSLDAVQDASASNVERVKAEVLRQETLNHSWAADRSLAHFNQVRDLLHELLGASAERQAAIFKNLERLGPDGVPAIIAQMDDRRTLADPHISLTNSAPDAFEGVRHYAPELVVDALDAILNQITGAGGSIVNSGSERERRNAVRAWRVYASDLKCKGA